jgi:NNP family nitrate/nitrite transporter-like MFS transporter
MPLPPSPSAPDSLTKPDGFVYMGIMIIGLTLPLFFVWFPMWGSMLTGPREGAEEEDYYMREWSAEEVAQGLHQPSMRFAMESK